MTEATLYTVQCTAALLLHVGDDMMIMVSRMKRIVAIIIIICINIVGII